MSANAIRLSMGDRQLMETIKTITSDGIYLTREDLDPLRIILRDGAPKWLLEAALCRKGDERGLIDCGYVEEIRLRMKYLPMCPDEFRLIRGNTVIHVRFSQATPGHTQVDFATGRPDKDRPSRLMDAYTSRSLWTDKVGCPAMRLTEDGHRLIRELVCVDPGNTNDDGSWHRSEYYYECARLKSGRLRKATERGTIRKRKSKSGGRNEYFEPDVRAAWPDRFATQA